MDQIIQQIAGANQNPDLRDELIHHLWNASVGADFKSPEELSAALSAGENPRLVVATRQWLGLPVIE